MEGLIASVDIGATKVSVTLSGNNGILFRLYQRVILEGDEVSIPEQVRTLITKALEETGTDISDLLAVGISSAGPFRRTDGMIELVSPNICGGLAPERGVLPNDWTSVPIERELRGHFRSLRIENDAVAGAVAERTFGPDEDQNLLYVTWSTGIGTGAFVDGRLIRGKNGNAPHGGHVYLDTEGPVCGCGNIADLESLASGTSIALQYGQGASTAEVFEKYHEGDPNARMVIEKVAKFFAKGLATINSILDTKVIAIGGSVFLNHKDLLLPMVKKEFYRSFPLLSGEVIIRPTSLGEYLGDMAAISLVIPDGWVEDWKRRRYWESSPGKLNEPGIV